MCCLIRCMILLNRDSRLDIAFHVKKVFEGGVWGGNCSCAWRLLYYVRLLIIPLVKLFIQL